MVESFELKVIGTKQETPDVKSIRIEKPAGFEFKPGQYMRVELDVDDPENGNTRPLSIASSPTEDFMMFSTKISQSLFKQKFSSVGIGDKIKIKGPMGIFTLKEDVKKIIFLGGGIGITPFRGMIKYASDKKLPIEIILIYSNRTPNDIVYRIEWPLLERENPNLKVVNTVTDSAIGWEGRTGRIDEEIIKEFCDDFENTIFYICGPPGMVNGMQELLKAINVPQQNVKIE